MRQELAARNLNSKGLKSQLQARLVKAVKSEQAREEGRHDEVEDEEEVAASKDDIKEIREIKDGKEIKDPKEDKKSKEVLLLLLIIITINFILF